MICEVCLVQQWVAGETTRPAPARGHLTEAGQTEQWATSFTIPIILKIFCYLTQKVSFFLPAPEYFSGAFFL